MKKKIYQVDAFTDKVFGGNPAGVVIDAEGLSEEQMKQIAKEMNLSETAFVFTSKEKDYDYIVKFFTPTQEVELCGHATIATCYTIYRELVLRKEKIEVSGGDSILPGVEKIILSLMEMGVSENDQIEKDINKRNLIVRQKTKAGILPVELNFDNDRLDSVMMTQTSPNFDNKYIDSIRLASIMGLDIDDIGIDGANVKPQIVSTGLKDIMLPLKNLSSLKKINPDFNKLEEFSKELDVVGVHAFTMNSEEIDADLACRNFAPAAGIDEEAATGTSNGALGAYLVKNDVISLKETIKIICEQGYYMNRPSQIIVEISGSKDNMEIKVGGKAVVVVEGIINL